MKLYLHAFEKSENSDAVYCTVEIDNEIAGVPNTHMRFELSDELLGPSWNEDTLIEAINMTAKAQELAAKTGQLVTRKSK